jgi:CheY-like chemotaxis protein
MKAQRKILVADCHEDVLIVLEKLLEHAGFDTTTVWTARDALNLVDSLAFRSRAGQSASPGSGM